MSPAQINRLLQDALGHHQAGRLDQAEPLYRRVLAAQPQSPQAWHMLGLMALQRHRPAEAVEPLTRAQRLAPRSAMCAMQLGLAHSSSGHPAVAERWLRTAVELDPKLAVAWENLAYCLKTQDRLAEAVDCHRRSLALNPRHAPGWYNYGLTLSLRGESAEALGCHERALQADPGYAKGHFGRAQALQQLHRIPEAIAAYGEYLRREPGDLKARSFRLMARQYVDGLSREELFAEHLEFGRRAGADPRPEFPGPPDPDRRLRIGVLSPDLRAHSCAFFLEPLIRHLDPAAFEVFLYHDHFRDDATSARLRQGAAAWRGVVGQPADAVERTIRADAPDLMIDLAAHTGLGNQLPLFARRLAPVQITYLGYPDTTGVAAMDYRFTDGIADPEGEADRFATEKLVRFAPTAWSYQPPDFAPEPAPPPCADGRPPVFGSFNNPAKITDRMLAVWARLLAAVPGSRLRIKGRVSGGVAAGCTPARLAAAGLPVERVDLLDRTEDARAHLALYREIDVALDTFPYHGTTTTCEALWMGRPVVTLAGDRHASRVGVSLLTAIGRPEWIARDADEYVRLAAGLVQDRARLREQSNVLRYSVARSPLCDHAGQAARFGAALRACWREWCATRAPVLTHADA